MAAYQAWHWIGLIALAMSIALTGHRRSMAFAWAQKFSTRIGVGTFLLLIELAWYLFGIFEMGDTWKKNLPFHICDLGMLAIFYALLLRPRAGRWPALVYFLSIPGPFLALVIPEVDPPGPFQMLSMIKFLISHSLILVVGIHLSADAGFRPSVSEAFRAWLKLLAIGVLVSVMNRILGTNFMFVSEATSAVAAFSELPFAVYLLLYALVMLASFAGLTWVLRCWNFVKS